MARRPATRGGHQPTGTGAERRANTGVANGAKAQRTRDELLEAARYCFGKFGYANTNVERIVNQAGLARGSFYTYFESKAELFRLLVATIDRDIAAQVATLSTTTKGDVFENLLVSNRNYLRVVARNADLYRLVDEMAAHDAEVQKSRLKSRQKHISRVAETIRRWQRNGLATKGIDADLTAAALVSMLSGFAQWVHVGGDTYDEESSALRLTEIWANACGLRTSRKAAK